MAGEDLLIEPENMIFNGRLPAVVIGRKSSEMAPNIRFIFYHWASENPSHLIYHLLLLV